MNGPKGLCHITPIHFGWSLLLNFFIPVIVGREAMHEAFLCGYHHAAASAIESHYWYLVNIMNPWMLWIAENHNESSAYQ